MPVWQKRLTALTAIIIMRKERKELGRVVRQESQDVS
jgi:hypothetical protein